MELQNPLIVFSYAFGLTGLVGGIFAFLRYSNYKATVQLQNDNIKALQDQANILKAELDASKKAHTEAMGAIKRLQGNLDAYKEIPLKEIAVSLAKLSDSTQKVSDSNQEILATLKRSALIAAGDASDGGLLVRTEKTQTVTVPN